MPIQQVYPTDCTHDRETHFRSIKASDIFFLLLLLFFFSLLLELVVRQSGICATYYGQEQYQQMLLEAKTNGHSLSSTRLTLWSTGIAYPVLALLFPLFFKMRTGLGVSILGIHNNNLPQTLRLALRGAILLLPATYLLQAIVVWGLEHAGVTETTDHPLAGLTGQALGNVEKALLFLSAVAGAAILEEEVFRGLLLPWFSARPRGATYAAFSALFITLVSQCQSLWHAITLLWQNNMFLENQEDRTILFQALLPVIFCLTMVQLIHLAAQKEAWRNLATIIAVGLLFGMIHNFAWPSPIALTLLGSGMGMVFFKSGNLLGPILIHSIFNGFAFLLIIFAPT